MNNTSLTKRETQLLYPKFNEVEGGYTGFILSVCLSVCVCGQNHVRCVSSIILARFILYLRILSSNFRRCVAYNFFFKIKRPGKFFKFVTLTLSCFDLGSNMNWSIVWIIMCVCVEGGGGGGGGVGGGGVGGVSSERRCSSCSSCIQQPCQIFTFINSSSPSAAYMHQWIGSALVQLIACHLVGTQPLSKPMLGLQTSVKF